MHSAELIVRGGVATKVALAVSLALACGVASAAVLDASSGDVTAQGEVDGVVSTAGHKATVTGDTITVTGDVKGTNASAANSTILVGETSSGSVYISASGQRESAAIGVATYEKATTTVLGGTIDITSTASTSWAEGVAARSGSSITIGDANTKSISIKANATPTGDTSLTKGVLALKSSVTLNAETVNIESNGGFGIHVQNNTQDATAPEGAASITINAKDTTITGKDIAISAFSNGQINISGNLTASAKNVIDTRGNATININQDGKGVVVLKGDVVFETPNAPGDAQNSGNLINSNVNINLTTAGSSWDGRAYQGYRVSDEQGGYTDVTNVELEAEPYHGNVTDFKLNVANGGVWNVTGDSFVNHVSLGEGGTVTVQEGAEKLNAGTLDLNNGTLTMADSTQTVNVTNLAGTGGTVNAAVTVGADDTATAAQLKVGSVGTGGTAPILNVVASGITADDVTVENQEAVLEALNGAVAGTGETPLAVTKTNTVAEGDVKGAITQTVDAGGNVDEATQTANTKLSAYSQILSMGTFLWRHDMNDLTKRMGELRDSSEGVGSWVRLYGSEQEYGTLTSKNTSVQVGTDVDVGAGWKVGAAFSYTDGSAEQDNASSDSDMYGFAVYGSWLAQNGLFVDLIGKYSRLSTDFTAGNMTGSYDNNAWSASAEAGWHLPVMGVAFVEPQVELTYGQIIGDDFTAGNGVEVSQDDTDSFIGRLGVRSGFYFPEKKGTVYARVSVLHDFDGEVTSTAVKGGASETMFDDLGGTWWEFGLGANFNLTDRTYTYVDLEKTTGGEVQENWRWNVGLRHVW